MRAMNGRLSTITAFRSLGPTLALLAIATAAGLIYGNARWNALTRQLMARLGAARSPTRPMRYDAARELAGLPPPVQRYFRTVLHDGTPIVAAASVQHRGRFNMSDSGPEQWRPFTSTQRVVTRRPGFVWDGRVQILPGLAVHVHDAYVAGEADAAQVQAQCRTLRSASCRQCVARLSRKEANSMDLATQTHLKALRDALEFRLQELRGDIDAAAQALLAEPALAAGEVTDRKDMAGRRAAAELADEAERLDLAESERVEAALRRLDEGTYDDCADCGEPIGLPRLQVMPGAPRCARCQAASERGSDAADRLHRR
jgi:RNA polymerase-binding transcription factor DksA